MRPESPQLGTIGVWAAHLRSRDRGRIAGTRERHPGRMLLGLGSSHAPLVEATDRRYLRPFSAMRDYLDALDAAPSPVPAGQRMLAALGPRMLELSAQRSLGAHPYLVDAMHTAVAREALGPEAVLAPELKVVLDTDPGRARATARAHLASYLQLPNYTRNLLRTGYTESDVADGGSDRLVDGVVACGDVDVAMRRAQDHIDAGAEHICVQVLTADRREVPFAAWRELAPALLSGVAPRRPVPAT